MQLTLIANAGFMLSSPSGRVLVDGIHSGCDGFSPVSLPCLEEMADLAEVLLALCEAHGYTAEELHAARLKKREERGGFRDRIFLHEVR